MQKCDTGNMSSAMILSRYQKAPESTAGRGGELLVGETGVPFKCNGGTQQVPTSTAERGGELLGGETGEQLFILYLLKSNKKKVAKLHVFRAPKNSHVADEKKTNEEWLNVVDDGAH
jgi:hypothetical protein